MSRKIPSLTPLLLNTKTEGRQSVVSWIMNIFFNFNFFVAMNPCPLFLSSIRISVFRNICTDCFSKVTSNYRRAPVCVWCFILPERSRRAVRAASIPQGMGPGPHATLHSLGLQNGLMVSVYHVSYFAKSTVEIIKSHSVGSIETVIWTDSSVRRKEE
jgi:hypothetical protein